MNRVQFLAVACAATFAFAAAADAQNRTIGTSSGSLDRNSEFSLGELGSLTPQRTSATGSMRSAADQGGFNTFGNAALGGFGTGGLGGVGGLGGIGGLGGPGGFLLGRSQFGAGGQNQQLNGQNQIPGDLRFRIRTGFTVAPIANHIVSERLSTRLMNIQQVQRLGVLDVLLTDRTVTLKGTVASDHARQLAERLVMLEPGVSKVKNELTVAETAVSPETSGDPAAELLPLPTP